MNLISTAYAAFLLLGNAFFLNLGCVKQGVLIDGIPVGGMPYAEAEAVLRENLLKNLPPVVVHAPSGDLTLKEELTLSENAASLVRKAKKGQSLTLSYSREWADMETVLFDLCCENARPAENAELSFSARGFAFTPETPGLACDYFGLLKDVTEILDRGGEVTLRVRQYSPAVTEKLLRERTQKLSSFTTRFDPENAPRVHNIALAAKRIAGTALAPGEEFSFNKTVGERTKENGFEVAAVIKDGKFVPGVGGGVCQTSTTLFGAALRAGLNVTESRAHSLSVGYVPPSLDAMVSSCSDLKFVNPYDFPVYLLGSVRGGSVSFSVYGMPDGKRYETESVVLARIKPPKPEIVEGEVGILKQEKAGIKSESFLLVYDENGRLLSRSRIRKDCYAAVRGKVGALPPADEPQRREGRSDRDD